jgi:23S rRNA (adenine2030-N6)-methyltransferase
MNYRHGFHAGNFADVFKHAILARILAYMLRKEAPLRFIDTHAGAGRYDLAGAEARRSPEWREGVARLLKAKPPPRIAELLAPYLSAIGALGKDGAPLLYPGSPAIAQAMLRDGDRIALCEAHEEERQKLIAALGHDHRLSIVATDGYVALNAYVPPKERRGLVLIDPAYEETDEATRVAEALGRALAKWPSGVYALWRPIRELVAEARFLNTIAALGAPDILNLTLDVGPGAVGPQGQRPLAQAGMLVVNPPYVLMSEARILLPWLAETLARQGRGACGCAWLTRPGSPAAT